LRGCRKITDKGIEYLRTRNPNIKIHL